MKALSWLRKTWERYCSHRRPLEGFPAKSLLLKGLQRNCNEFNVLSGKKGTKTPNTTIYRTYYFSASVVMIVVI